MFWLLWVSLAYADSNEVFARREQPVVQRRYAQLTQNQPPKGRYRSRRGRFRTWSWPDGVIEHFEEWERGALVRRQRFNPSGSAITTVMYRKKQPHHVIVHGPSAREVDLTDWESWSVDGAVFLVPDAPETGGEVVFPEGTMRVTWGEGIDVFSDEARKALLEGCGCVLQDRSAVWVAGQVGVRYRLFFPHPQRPRTGEMWMLPTVDGRALLIAAIAEAVISDPGALATARAMVSLLTLESPQ